MAAIHAEFWMDPSPDQHDRLPGHGFWFTTPDLEKADDFFATYGVRFVPICVGLIGLFWSRLAHAQSTPRSPKDPGPWTLVHGDQRADILWFTNQENDAPDLVIIDWSWQFPCATTAPA